MEWNQLHCFLVAAQEENLSRAAQTLHISQPSLSQTIKRLEEELGYALFAREGKRIRLNKSGQILMQTVIQMEELMHSTRQRLEELNGMSHPEVSIYIGCASTLLPELLRYLRERNPQVQYRIHQWNVQEQEREDDIQILAGSIGGTTGRSENEILMEEELVLALPKNHGLITKPVIYLKDLTQQEFISLNTNWVLGQDIEKEMKKHLFVPRTTMWVDNPNLMRELLREHMGIAFVPSISWHSFAGEEVIMRPVEDCRMSRCIYLNTQSRKYLTKEQKECIRGIKEFFAAKKKAYGGRE